MSTKFDLQKGIVALSKFRQNSKKYLAVVNQSREILILTQNGQSTAVVISPREYQKMEYERDFFKSVAEGEKDVDSGDVISHEKLFDELLK